MNLKNFEQVLVLATKPKGKPSIVDWCPFDNVTLDKIINQHNQKSVEFLQQKQKWPQNFIEEFGQFLAVANYDLPEVDGISLAQFQKIKFVFFNLNELATAATAVEHVKAMMNQARRVYYLVQISKPVRPTELARFVPSPVLTSQPEVIDDQDKLEQWLADLYRYYDYAISETIESPPSGQGGPGNSPGSTTVTVTGAKPGSWTRVFMDYRPSDPFARSKSSEGFLPQRSLTDIASQVRDAAVQKRLTETQTRALARKAVLQEEALGYVQASVSNKLDLKTGDELLLDCLRKPVGQIPIEDEYIEKTPTIDVMTVKLAQPFGALSKTQSALCSDLRLDQKNRHVLLRSSPENLKKLEGLKNVIETHNTGLTLPFDASDLLI